MIEADLWRLGQAGPGAQLRFMQVTYQQALAASTELEAALAGVEAMAARLRGAALGWTR